MKAIEIEWRRLVKDAAGCRRCGERPGGGRDCRRIDPQEESHALTPAWLVWPRVWRRAGCC
jgi:hypothetical protein